MSERQEDYPGTNKLKYLDEQDKMSPNKRITRAMMQDLKLHEAAFL